MFLVVYTLFFIVAGYRYSNGINVHEFYLDK